MQYLPNNDAISNANLMFIVSGEIDDFFPQLGGFSDARKKYEPVKEKRGLVFQTSFVIIKFLLNHLV